MSLFDSVRIAVRAIVANRLRSALTSLGLVIGVSSVIVLIAVGQGAQKGVTDQIRGLGTDLIFVEPGAGQAEQGGANAGPRSATTLLQSDAEAIAQSGIPGVTAVSSQISLNAQAIAGAENLGVEVIGTTAEYIAVRDVPLASGGFLTAFQVAEDELVIVLGSSVSEALFGVGADPVGQTARLSFAGGRITFEFRVVGLMAPRGGSGDGGDDQVFIPLTSLQSRFAFLRNATGNVNVSQIDIQTAPGVDKEAVKQQVTALLLFLHEVVEPDFLVQSQDDLISAATEVSDTLSILLGSIAGISLLVGGIGVMNIMLVSVSERTREIGIRRAVGARANDIVGQFVTEALTLSLGSGLIGVALGIGISAAVSGREVGGQELTTVVQPWSVIVAFAVAAGVGLISGSYPAYRATAIDPIEALRNE